MGRKNQRMGVAHSSGRAETVHSLDISPSLHNELEQLAVKQQKMEEQQAFEAHFAQVDAEAAKRFESISQAEVPRLVSVIEENCFRPTERSYPCQAQKDACLQCFASSGDLLKCAQQLEAFKACSELKDR